MQRFATKACNLNYSENGTLSLGEIGTFICLKNIV